MATNAGRILAMSVSVILRWGLGLLFIWAGAVKLAAPHKFAQILDAYGLLPKPALLWAAWGLPLLELVVGAGMLADRPWGLLGLTALLLLFWGVLGLALLQGLDVDCGCFSPEEMRSRHSIERAFWRDTVFLILAGWLHWMNRRNGRIQAFLEMKRSFEKIPKDFFLC